MYVFENRLAFIAHPRTASRSVSDALIEGGAIRWQDMHHQVDMDKLIDIRHAGGVVACVKRNMFDVLVSWFYRSRVETYSVGYMEKSAPTLQFEIWLKTILKGGHEYLDRRPYHHGIIDSSIVIDFVDLNYGIHGLMIRCGMPPVSLGHRGKSNRLNYTEYYTTEARQLVEQRWSKDLALTGYKFGD